jgi:hypothetical protein
MRTRPAFSEVARAHELRARLARPRIIEIDGATAYWLEGLAGQRASPESPSSADPLAAVLAAFEGEMPPADLVLVCRLVNGDRYEIGGGDELVDAALGAAGRPAVRLPRSRRTASRRTASA